MHLRKPALDITGFNHACGTAVDSKGDVYVASAGESAVKVYSPAHALLATIANANQPCGVAVDGTGNLYVSEKATGKVVRYAPDVYPLSGSPIYGSPTTIDNSGEAKGIAVDPHDNRLYVAKGTRVAVYLSNGTFEANLGEGDLSNAVGVAAFTYFFEVAKNFEGVILDEFGTRYLFVADTASSQLKIFSGEVFNPTKEPIAAPKLRRTITGVDHDRNPETPAQALGFGPAGAYLAVDPGNRNEEEKCTSVAKQACTAGHFLLYDDAHEALDEFDASGEFLDQMTDAELGDAEPSAMAVDRSGTANDGTIRVSSGPGAGAKLLAYGPLKPPSREEVPARSQVLANAQAVATDARGNLYAAADAVIHVFDPEGTELTTIADANVSLEDLAVDSKGNVYVLENRIKVTYYAPAVFPPVSGTTYTRHEPAVATSADLGGSMLAIAVNPGPGAKKDHLFVTAGSVTHEHDSAANGSALLDSEFAKGLCGGIRRSMGVYGANGNAYFGLSTRQVCIVEASGKEVVAKIGTAGAPGGLLTAEPKIAVDQSHGHVFIFTNKAGAAREYDAAGGFVAEFGGFTKELIRPQRIAIDNACAVHEPPLTEATTPSCEQFDPAGGNVYVAFDDTKPGTPDVWAFGPLQYGEPPEAVTGAASGVGGGAATLSGSVDPRGFEVTECKFEYLTEEDFQTNGENFAGAASAACVPNAAGIGDGKAPVAVQAEVSGLDPEERYLFRLVAENEFGPSEGEPELFGPPIPTTKPAIPILYTEATLRGSVDPSGLPTKYWFEYGEGGGPLDQSTAVGEIASGAGPTEVKAVLLGLAEGVEYHFRLVAESEAGTLAGAELGFTTLAREGTTVCPNAEYRFGASANLPDCRAYELLTPAETNGLSPYSAGPGSPGTGMNHWLVTPRGAGAGETFSYYTNGTLPGIEGSGRLDGYHARRGEGEHPPQGWSTELFGPSFVQAGETEPRPLGISPDQSHSFWSFTPLVAFEGTLPDGNYLQTPEGVAAPPCDPVPTQSSFEFVGCGEEGADPKAESRYLAPGGTHVIFTSTAHLEPEASPAGIRAVYDRAAGSSSAEVLTVPSTGASEEEVDEFLGALGSKEQAAFLGASTDGTVVAFEAGADLYVRRDGAVTDSLAPRTAQVGDTLSCAGGPLLGGGSRPFQWLRNTTPIPGAEGENDIQFNTDYTAAPADSGAALQCRVRRLNGATGSVAISAPVEIAPLEAGQEPKPPARIAAPTPADPGTGTVETCDPGTWEGTTELTYHWYVDGEKISGATSPTYQVQAADVPGTIQCAVSGSNSLATVARASALTPTSPPPAEPALLATAQAAAKTTYAGISEDGRYVFFAMGKGDAPARLFRSDTQTESTTELAPASIFLNVSADGSHALLTSEEALTGSQENEAEEEAQGGERNLYLWGEAGIEFLAILTAPDFTGFGGIAGMDLGSWVDAVDAGGGWAFAPTRSTPDGAVFLFQSHAQLTDYDNEGFAEVYRYAPAAPAGERLTCPSCDPGNAPPSGDALLEEARSGTGLAAETIIPNVTDDGVEVFFQSPDPLVPTDANQVTDVYRWRERYPAGGCDRAGGCLALISSGQGEVPSVLYAMSADGHDVFIRTKEKLVAADVAGSTSVYDAREEGGIPEPGIEEDCQGDACQGSGTPPPVLPTPSTAGGGNGNVLERPATRHPCRKGRHRVRGRCVPRHKKHRRHRAGGQGGSR